MQGTHILRTKREHKIYDIYKLFSSLNIILMQKRDSQNID